MYLHRYRYIPILFLLFMISTVYSKSANDSIPTITSYDFKKVDIATSPKLDIHQPDQNCLSLVFTHKLGGQGLFIMEVSDASTPNNIILYLIDTLHVWCWCEHWDEHTVYLEKVNTSDTITITIVFFFKKSPKDTSILYDSIFIHDITTSTKQTLKNVTSQKEWIITWKEYGNNYLLVDIPKDVVASDITCLLYDMHGRVVSRNLLKSQSQLLVNTTNLCRGNYILWIGRNKALYSGQLIIK